MCRFPKHPRIHHLGFVDDQDKYDAMAAAEVLIMPSYLESLSMVALEAWAMGKPVLANAKCDVLQGQCLRSNAGLFYANYPEFAETLRAIDTTPSLQAALGRNGRAFFERHYAWPVIVQKYVDMLNQLSREKPARAMEPLPGWLTRRRRNLPPADAVVSQLPKGPYRERPQPKRFGPPFDFAQGRQPAAFSRACAVPRRRASQSPAPPSAPNQRRFERPRRPEPARAEGAKAEGGRRSTAEEPKASEDRRASPRATAIGRDQHTAPPSSWAPTRRPAPAMSIAIHQVLPSLGYGDAIGHEALGIQRVLRAAGYESEIFAQTADPRVEDLTVGYRDLRDASHPDNILIHHFSIGSRASRLAYALPDRMVLIYHNITPPEFFVDVNKELVRLCFRGRRELALYKTRCDLALGDSEYNRQELEALGFSPDRRPRRRPRFRSPRRAGQLRAGRCVRRRLGQRAVRRSRHPEQEV